MGAYKETEIKKEKFKKVSLEDGNIWVLIMY